MKAFKFSILAVVLLFGTVFAFSQAANEQGIKPYGSFHGDDIDQINVSNGHLELRIPLLTYPQRGGRLALNFVARFHNAVWNERKDCVPTTNICFHYWVFDQQPGIQVLTEQMPPSISQVAIGNTNSSSPIYAYAIVAADESQHPLGNIGGTEFESLDTTGMKWDSSTQTFTLSNGSRYLESNNSAPVLEDSNGNQITFTYGNAISDTMGRSIPWPGGSGATQDYSGCTGSLPVSSASLWIVPGANGSSSTFKLCFAQVKVFTHHWTLKDTSTNKYVEPNGFYSMVQSIVLPDQTAWTFDYSQPDANGVNWGDLVKATLPTGGSITYAWGHGPGCHHLFGPPGSWSGGVHQRVIDAQDGSGPQTWAYGPGSGVGQSKVTDPLGNDTVHTFTDLNTSCALYETKTESYQGSQSGGTLLKTVSTDYSWAASLTSQGTSGQNPPPINVVPIRKTISWPNGQVKKTEYAYDAGFTYNSPWGSSGTPPTATGIYGKETVLNEFDYGANAAGGLLKSTQTIYLWQSPVASRYIDNNVLDVPTVVTVQDGSGKIASQTTISYDGAVPVASGIATAHEANPVNGNVRGNATSTGRWLSGSTVSTANCPVAVTNGSLATTKTYLDTGMVSQSKDACLQQTNIQYSSVYAGTYPTSSCDALKHCTTTDYDFNTGGITGITDPNGQVTGKKTIYTYDDIGRFTSVTYPDGGQTNAYYPNSTTVEVKKLQDSAANIWIDQYTYFDPLLRAKQTRLVDPEGDVYSETTYDALGRAATVTNPHRSTAAPTDGTTTTHYDALGRVINVIRPDGNALQKSYSDPTVVTLIDETGRPRRETHDALGRLIKFEEPSGGTVGSKATASVTVNGTLQSKIVGGQPAIPATATISISGIGQCSSDPLNYNCDFGTVTLTVGGASPDTVYYSGSSAQNIAQSLASGLSSTQVTATASQVTDSLHWQIKLTAAQAGPGGNGIAFGISQSSFYPGQWAVPYTFGPVGGSLTGGQNAIAGTTVYDAGTVTVALNGYSATASYGNGAGLDGTGAAVASDLVSQIQAQLPGTNPPFSISVPAGGTAISVTWGSVGSAGNLNAITTSSTTTQTNNFSAPSFAGCQPVATNPQNCNAAFSGGTDPYSLDSSPSWPTLYSYDLLNNLLRVEQHGNTTDSTQWRVRTFQYDSLSRLTQSNNPEAGQLNYTYDAAGSVITRKDARGITITYGYDPLHRLTIKQYSDGSSPREYFYDAPSGGNAIGRLTHASNDVNAAFNPTYDPMGRITSQIYCIPSDCNYDTTVSATYDLVGHLKSLTYPSGRTVTSGYNSAGRALNSVFSTFGSLSFNYPYYTAPQAGTPSAWGYNPDGSLRAGTFGNGIVETYGFNNRQQLNSITASSSGQTWLSKIFGLYDVNSHDNGTIWSIVDGISQTRNQFYQYDAVGRVTSGYQQDNAFNQTFNYDPWGNMSTSGTNNFNPLYDGNNRVSGAPANCTASNTYCYDAAGNMLNDAFHQYAYDGENRVKAVDNTGAAYTYGPMAERVRKDVGGKATEYVFFEGIPIAEKDVSSGYWSDYIFFNGRRIARANNFEHQLHISGQECAGCGWQYYQYIFSNIGSLSGYTVQTGDSLRWLQWQNTGSAGGVIITFSDGTQSWMDGMALADQNGEQILRSSVVNKWNYRLVSLSAAAGKTISDIRINADGTTQPGQWDIYYQDMVFIGADGSIRPLFSQNPVAPGMTGIGTTGMTQTAVTIHDCSGSGCAAINTTSYFHGDQIGSARMLSEGYGYPVWQGTFTPFGQEASPQITSNHYKFNGKERGDVSEGGLDYFGARYYSSVIGRWMTPDWSDEPSPTPYAKLTDPQSLNLYSFVTDDPLSRTDVDGHFQMAPANGPCPNNNGDTCGAMGSAYKCSVGMTTFCQQAADEATEAAQRNSRGINEMGSQNGKTYVTRNVGGAYIYDKGGHVIASVSLTVVAYFSEKEGEEGKFLGAELVVKTFKSDKDGNVPLGEDPTTKSIPITYGQAVRAMGANSVGAAANSAATDKLFFFRELGKDHHGVVAGTSTVTALGSALVCLAAEPCGAVAVGVGTGATIIGGLDWVAERFKWF